MFRRLSVAAMLALFLVASVGGVAWGATAQEINRKVFAALKLMQDTVPAAKSIEREAKGVLVFPEIIKAGFIIGGQHGVGALLQRGKITGYYSTSAASYGLQLGVQEFGYAMFLMSDSAMENLKTSDGWAIGSDPNIVVFDKGIADSFNTTTARKDVYVIFFEQKGLMLGLGIQGTKISAYSPDK